MNSNSENSNVNTRRKAVTTTVCYLLTELGFEAAEREAIETLTEMIQSFLTQVGISGRSFCELSGRTEPVIGDVIMALVEMGISIDGIEAHAYRSQRSILPQLSQSGQPKQLQILQAGQKQPHPSHIPNHLPSFPDPHAYIRTPTHKQPVTEYEAIREKAASQKRDVERALTRFIARTGETHSLFVVEDTNVFPLIACKPLSNPYLHALDPKDQIFEEDEDEILTRKRKDEEKHVEGEDSPKDRTESANESDLIDNPYLRPVKMPKKKKR